jgi:hypothetical protein
MDRMRGSRKIVLGRFPNGHWNPSPPPSITTGTKTHSYDIVRPVRSCRNKPPCGDPARFLRCDVRHSSVILIFLWLVGVCFCCALTLNTNHASKMVFNSTKPKAENIINAVTAAAENDAQMNDFEVTSATFTADKALSSWTW